MKTSEFDPAVAESIEAEVWYQIAVGTPEAAARALGVEAARIGGGVVTSMRNDVTNFWSKALGFGITEPITTDLIGDVIDFYRAHGDSRAGIQIAPSMLPAGWDDIVAEHGLRPGGGIIKHVGAVEALQLGSSDLRVAQVGAADADQWARVMMTAFGMPLPGLAEMTAAIATNPAFSGFAAWDDQRIVATGSLLTMGNAGSLHAGATLIEDRGRGAQSALIAARVQAAAAAGCQWVVAETAEDGPSMKNLRRAGFQPLYFRSGWVWQNT